MLKGKIDGKKEEEDEKAVGKGHMGCFQHFPERSWNIGRNYFCCAVKDAQPMVISS